MTFWSFAESCEEYQHKLNTICDAKDSQRFTLKWIFWPMLVKPKPKIMPQMRSELQEYVEQQNSKFKIPIWMFLKHVSENPHQSSG